MKEHMYDGMKFNWNETKAMINERKHNVTFEEAATAFSDMNAHLYDDDEHSQNEERFILLGYSKISRLLVICHCYRSSDNDVVRIISARKAEPSERKLYEERG